MRRMHTFGPILAALLIAACGGSGGSAATTAPPTTAAPATTAAPTTTEAPAATTTTMSPADACGAYGDAMKDIAQRVLYQTFDGGAAFEHRLQGDALAAALRTVADEMSNLRAEIDGLGDPPPGFEDAVALMLEAIDTDVQGYSDAADAATAGDQAAVDAGVAMVDDGFRTLMSANVALSAAQACTG